MKIFGIGFHKTGTTSLAKALEHLGYRVRHGYKSHSDMMANDLKDRRPGLTSIEEKLGPFNAYLDLYTLRMNFTAFDNDYPDSKFILTTRDDTDWIESCKKQRAKRSDSPFYHYWYYQSIDQWRLEKMAHEYAVRAYFSERPDDLLIMDITKGEGWDELCSFLGLLNPTVEFPHLNKSKK